MRQTDNTFSVSMPIITEKSRTVQDGEDTRIFITGRASGIGVDLENERMAETAIHAFKKAIDEGYFDDSGTFHQIPLRSGHRKEWDDQIGWIVKAEVDDEHNLWIEAELDADDPTAAKLYKRLTRNPEHGRPSKLGFSVGGKIKRARNEWDANLQKNVRVIDDVILREISVVGQPANPTTYVEALMKSVDWDHLDEVDNKEIDMGDTVTKNDDAVVVDDVVEVTDTTPDSTTVVVEENLTETSTTEPAVVTEAQTEENTEEVAPVATDPQVTQQLETQVEDLAKQVSELTALVQSLVGTQTETAQEVVETQIEKSVEETVSDLEKSLSDRVADAIREGLAEITKSFSTELEAVKAAVNDLAAEPMDKSFVSRKQKDGDEDFVEKFRKDFAESDDPLEVAIRYGMNRNRG